MKRTKYMLLAAGVMLAAIMVPVFAGGKKDSAQGAQAVPDTSVNVAEATPEAAAETSAPAAPAPQADPKRIAYNHDDPGGNPVQMHEVWGYVMTDREYQFSNDMPITDLCYFSADVNSYGEISSVPKPTKFKGYKGRIHLVVTCTGRALSHMVLDPQFGQRQKIIDTIATAAKSYDGIQIDFENVGARDAKNFRTFLADIRKRIGQEKWFTVALAARTRTISDDIYPYKEIEPLVDRIIIMAYDEHWSGSKPGSVASMAWCEKVVDYCQTVIPKKKLVMGLPFYGRSWQDESYGSAWVFNSMNRILNENNITYVDREDGVPYFTATIPVQVTAYFEDTYSLVTRCRLYEGKGVDRIAFWRVGQEDPTFWPWLTLK